MRETVGEIDGRGSESLHSTKTFIICEKSNWHRGCKRRRERVEKRGEEREHERGGVARRGRQCLKVMIITAHILSREILRENKRKSESDREREREKV